MEQLLLEIGDSRIIDRRVAGRSRWQRCATTLCVVALVTTLGALPAPASAQVAAPQVIDSDRFRPVRSSAHTPAQIALDAALRRRLIEMRQDGPAVAAASADGRALLESAAPDSAATPSADSALASANYTWSLIQTWLPDENGVQWCISGTQNVQPLGGVALSVLSGAYAGPRSLTPDSLVATLDAQELIPVPRSRSRARAGGMTHQFDYGTCVAPEFTRVGTYSTAVRFCGSERECAQHPHVSAVVLHLRPFLWSYDSCIDRQAGRVQISLAALYLDQRPTPASVQLLIDGSALSGADVSSAWPWLFVDYTMPESEYESRFGPNGSTVTVALASDNRYTPTTQLGFSKTDWLSPCVQ